MRKCFDNWLEPRRKCAFDWLFWEAGFHRGDFLFHVGPFARTMAEAQSLAALDLGVRDEAVEEGESAPEHVQSALLCAARTCNHTHGRPPGRLLIMCGAPSFDSRGQPHGEGERRVEGVLERVQIASRITGTRPAMEVGREGGKKEDR